MQRRSASLSLTSLLLLRQTLLWIRTYLLTSLLPHLLLQRGRCLLHHLLHLLCPQTAYLLLEFPPLLLSLHLEMAPLSLHLLHHLHLPQERRR